MTIPNDHTALLLIDIQRGFDDPAWGTRNNPQAERRAADLLGIWRQHGWPVWHVQHLSLDPQSTLRPGQDGARFKAEVEPRADEPIVQKHVNSAFIHTDLDARLRAAGVTGLVIVGLTTDHCVSTTARMAGNLGYQVLLPADAVATFDRSGPDGQFHAAQAIHDIHLASLHEEFATVTDTAAILAAVGAARR